MILKMIHHEYGPSLTSDNNILFYIYQEGLWRWIASPLDGIEYDDNGDLKIIGVDIV